MKCEACRELMMGYLKGQLDDQQRSDVEQHVQQCLDCTSELEGVRRLLSLIDAADAPGIHKLVRRILGEAAEQRASDVHIQPGAEAAVVRYRVDGVLRDVMQIPREQYLAVATRIKQMAQLDLLSQKVAQDGRIMVQRGERRIDVRVSTLPTVEGESVVMRLLVAPEEPPDFDHLGMSEPNREAFEKLIYSPCGVVIATGPTGCGTTTTLYAALRKLNRREVSIATVEDPVEMNIDGVNQVQVDQRAELGFPSAIRHILRQAPDIIMCGEIRDLETLNVAVQAALTGHLLLTTLHTIRAAGVLRRLADMGLERFLIADALLGALAQRLLRKLCPHCRRQRAPTAEESAWLRESGLEDLPEQLWVADGCDECRETGHLGRTATHEVLVMDEEVRALLRGDADMDAVERAAAGKARPMRHDAAQKVVEGVVDAAEAMRVLRALDLRHD